MNIEQLYTLYTKHFLVDTDTRKIRENTLFFALKGSNFNGNKFALEAIEKGAAYSIVDEKTAQLSDKIILVDDVLNTLQQLAQYHRTQLKIPIIGLTGSNGKTTTKELITTVLSTKYKTTATQGNLNNHIGVPLTLLSMTPDTEIGVVEMGANHPNEIAFLCKIAQPDYGYITNFGKAHIEGFGSIEGVIKAKSELYDYLKKSEKTAFINANDPIQVEKTDAIKTIPLNCKAVTFLEANPYVKIQYNKNIIQSHLIGNYNFNNILTAITIGKYFNIPELDIKSAIENYIPTNNRSQIIKKDLATYILDAYNANPTSMKAALENFSNLKSDSKTVILGDMFELGINSSQEHQLIANLVDSYNFENSYLIGQNFYATKSKSTSFENFNDFNLFFQKNIPTKGFVLIKGSRGMALERLLKS